MASRYFPHATHAEDQPYAYTILTTHTLHRGFQAGALIGAINGLVRAARLPKAPSAPPITLAGVVSEPSRAALARGVLLRSTGTGAIVGTGLLTVGLTARMWGREEVEWQDRSWRLLANKGQVETDDWSAVGSVVGGLGALLGGGRGVVRILGGVGLGNILAVGAMMGARAAKGELGR